MKTLLRLTAVFILAASPARAGDRLVIHEWGTLTSLEDEKGEPLAGINADDEPVPSFVHEVAPRLLYGPAWAGKGVPGVHPDVTVRLETPVFYVHAPAGFMGPLDVSVKYPGGWLTEFYPDAQATAPGIDPETGRVGHITGAGTLHWQGLKIGGDPAGPATTERVWLAPRNVAADALSTPGGESEKFLFYRGVGREGQILSIPRDGKTGTLRAFPRYAFASTPPFWLVDIRPDGAAAFQIVAPSASSRSFAEGDYSAANIAALRGSMETALTRAGLYKDEAEALLDTWEVSYFKNPGLRAFYIMPRACVDLLLPLTVSPSAAITRVMVGRVELITPAERAAMARINTSPESLQLFASLGRFRDALLLDEERRHPSPELESFMQRMSVAFYHP
jgi:hypothetical protein